MITRNDVRAFLADGEWHTGLEIMDHFRGRIEPEKAAQAFYASRRNDPTIIPEDSAVRLGEEMAIAEPIKHLLATRSVEWTGGKTILERRFHLTAWHCWLCGMIVNGDRKAVDGLCLNCTISIEKESGNARIAGSDGT